MPYPGAGAATEATRLSRVVREHIASLVRRRRREGASIHRVIAEIRCIVREAESCEGWHEESDALMSIVVRWTAEAYHDRSERERLRGERF